MKHSAPERGARRKGSGHGRVWSLCAALLFAALLVFSPASPLLAQSAITLLNGVSAASGNSVPLTTGSAAAVEIQLWSTNVSTSTIYIEQSTDGTHWYSPASTSNVAVAGAFWIGPPAPYTRVRYTLSAGVLYANLATLQSAQNVTGWKAIEAFPSTIASTSFVTTDDTSTNATYYPLFETGLGTAAAKTASTILTFNPSTGLLSSTGFAGALTGNADTATSATSATSATTATNATNSAITNATTAATMYPVWVTANSGNLPLKTTSGALSFYPSTGILTSTGFSAGVSGAFSGNRFTSTGTAPTVAGTTGNACGTSGAPSVAGKDQAGVITVGGTAATSCRLTFNVAFANPPACTANASTSATALKVVSTTGYIDIVSAAFTPAETISYVCLGY